MKTRHRRKPGYTVNILPSTNTTSEAEGQERRLRILWSTVIVCLETIVMKSQREGKKERRENVGIRIWRRLKKEKRRGKLPNHENKAS